MLDLLWAIGLLLQFLALGCLALSQNKHWRTLMGQSRLPPKKRLQWLGGAGLLVSLTLVVSVWGWSFASLIWLLSLPLAGYAIAFALALIPVNRRENHAQVAASTLEELGRTQAASPTPALRVRHRRG
jgi:hypothetical protein